jgi:hypothetical protein
MTDVDNSRAFAISAARLAKETAADAYRFGSFNSDAEKSAAYDAYIKAADAYYAALVSGYVDTDTNEENRS